MAMGTPMPGCAALVLVFLLTLGLKDRVEGCSCLPKHPQQHYCDSAVVIRAEILAKEVYNSTFDQMARYEIKVTKSYKSPEEDIKYVDTPVQSSLCGQELRNGNSYLLTGSAPEGGVVSINLCGFNKLWDTLPTHVHNNLKKNNYKKGCKCKITTCSYYSPCPATTKNECLWTEVQDILGEDAVQQTCLKQRGSCSWDQWAISPNKDIPITKSSKLRKT